MRMPSKKAHALLKLGDRVSIPGEKLQGTVTAVHPHEIIVRLESGEHRGFAHESLHRQSTFEETSNYIDH